MNTPNLTDIADVRADRAMVRTTFYFVIALACGAAASVQCACKSVVFDDELSWVQLLQDTCYAAGLVIAILAACRLRRLGRGEWTVVATVAFLMFFLLMREAEPDEQIFGLPHIFSLNYLFKRKIPLWAKLGAGIPAITILTFAAWWTWRHRVLIRAHFKPVIRRRWFVLLIAAAVLLGASQFIDRAESWSRRFGLVLPGLYEHEKQSLRNVEEIGELVGAMLVAFSMVELRINLLRGAHNKTPSENT